MATKKLNLRFNFNSVTPSAGDPNQYDNLAPGAAITPEERLRHALRAERFEVYEETFGQLVNLIGILDFEDFTLSEANQNVGGMILDLLERINRTNDRISSGSFPTRELFGSGIFRSFANQTPDSTAIIGYNDEVIPGEIGFNPEFEIIRVNNRTISLIGGKAISETSVVTLPTNLGFYDVEVENPDLVKNVEFDDQSGTYPESDINRIQLDFDFGENRFVGKIPVVRSHNGLPINFPIEPGTLQGLGNSSIDVRVVWDDNGTRRVLTDTQPDATVPDVNVEYPGGATADAQVSINPQVFLNANPAPEASDPSETLKVYIYYSTPAWRIDSIRINAAGNPEVIKGRNFAEADSGVEATRTHLYDVLVSSWNEDSSLTRTSTNWRLQSSILPLLSRKIPARFREADQIQDRRLIMDINRTARADWRNHRRNWIIPRKSQISTERGRPLTRDEMESPFGFLPPINNPAAPPSEGIQIPIVPQPDWSIIDQLGDTYAGLYDEKEPVLFQGISFKLYYDNGSPVEVTDLGSGSYIEYQILSEDNIIFQARSRYPQSGVPEYVDVEHTEPVPISSIKDFVLQVRLWNVPGAGEYYIIGEGENEIGQSIQLNLYRGPGIRDASNQFRFLTDSGATAGINLGSTTSLTSDGSAVRAVTEHNHTISVKDRALNISFEHDTDERDDNSNRYVTVETNWAENGSDTLSRIESQIDFQDFGELNSAGNTTSIVETAICSRGGRISFAVLMQYYSGGVVNESTETNAILVGTIYPTMGTPVRKTAFIGNPTDYPSSPLGLTKVLVRKALFYGTKGKQLSIGGDEEGNITVGFIGTRRGVSGDSLNFWSLSQNLEMRGELLEDTNNEAYYGLMVQDTTAELGRHSAVAILKEKIESNQAPISVHQLMVTDSNQAIETVMDRTEMFSTAAATSTNDTDQLELMASCCANGILRYLVSVTNGSGDNLFDLIELAMDEDNIVFSSSESIDLTSEFSRDPDTTRAILDRRSALIAGINGGGNAAVVLTRNGDQVFSISGSVSTSKFSLSVFEKSLHISHQSSNYVSAPENELEYFYAEELLPISYDGHRPEIEMDDGEGLFLGHFIDIGERFPIEENFEPNIVLDPHLSGESWAVGPSGSTTPLSDNYEDVEVPAGEVLEYTVNQYEGEIVFADLENRRVVVSWKSYVDGDVTELLNDECAIRLYNESGDAYPLIHREKGHAWFAINSDPGDKLTLTFVNLNDNSTYFRKVSMNAGWKPINLPDSRGRRLDRTSAAEIVAHGSADATTSDYDSSSAALRTQGGASINKSLYVGQNVDVGGNVQIDGDLVVSGNFLGRAPLGSVVPVFDNITGASVPASGVIDGDGWQLCDGASIAGGATLSGTTPDLTDEIFIRGYSSSGASGGSNSVVVTIPQHSHDVDDLTVINTGVPTITIASTNIDHAHTGGNLVVAAAGGGGFPGASNNGPMGGMDSSNPHTHTGTINDLDALDVGGSIGSGQSGDSTMSADAHDNQPKYINARYVMRVK